MTERKEIIGGKFKEQKVGCEKKGRMGRGKTRPDVEDCFL